MHNLSVLLKNRAVPVTHQDQTTPLLSSIFSQSVSGGNFTLSADTVASTVDVLNYTFSVNVGHTIVPGNEIILLDVLTDRSLQAKVVSVATNDITIDRPIDHVFPYAGIVPTLGRKTVSDLSVDGSVTPQIYTIRAGSIPHDYYGYSFCMIHSSEPDDSKFGDLNALTNGLVLRIVNGYQQTLFNFKKNGDFKRYGGLLTVQEKSGGGEYSTCCRINVSEIYGIAQRISGTSAIQIIVQDDLSGLTSAEALAFGHITEGENS